MALFPYMGAPQSVQGGLLGAAQNYSYPMTSGLLGALNQAQPQVQGVPDYTQQALQLAGNPHAGPYANAPGFAAPSGGGLLPSAGSTTGGSTASQIAGGLLGTLAKNPSLVKDGVQGIEGLLGLGSPSLAAFASGAPADAAVSQALGSVGSQVAPTSSAIQASNDAALNAMNGGSLGASGGLLSLEGLGSGAAANAAIASTLAPAVSSELGTTAAGIEAANSAALGGGGVFGATGGGAAAGGTGSAVGGSLLGAAGAAAIPLALLAAAAFVPDSSELTPQKIAGMENGVTAATQANGGPIGAAYSLNPNGTINPANFQTLADLQTLEFENPTEFAKAGGTGPITQYLQSQGYTPVNWSNVKANPNISQARGNTSGKQL